MPFPKEKDSETAGIDSVYVSKGPETWDALVALEIITPAPRPISPPNAIGVSRCGTLAAYCDPKFANVEVLVKIPTLPEVLTKTGDTVCWALAPVAAIPAIASVLPTTAIEWGKTLGVPQLELFVAAPGARVPPPRAPPPPTLPILPPIPVALKKLPSPVQPSNSQLVSTGPSPACVVKTSQVQFPIVTSCKPDGSTNAVGLFIT